MPSSARSDRQLMRQRGAGLRNGQQVDFQLKFSAGESRADRQLMRQRGAGNRKIDNVDFGFTFPTPKQNQRSVSKTPQHQVKRTREPSLSRSSQPGSNRSKRVISDAAEDQRRIPLIEPEQALHSRRPELSETPRVASTRLASQSRKSSGANFVIAEESDRSQGNVQAARNDVDNNEIDSGSPELRHEDHDKENQVQDAQTAKIPAKRRKRKSVIQHIGRKKKRLSDSSTQDTVIPSIETSEQVQDSPATHESPTQEHDHHEQPTQGGTSLPAREQSPQAGRKDARKSRKRKSVVLRSRKRKSIPQTSSPFLAAVVPLGSTEASEGQPAQKDTASHDRDGSQIQSPGTNAAPKTVLKGKPVLDRLHQKKVRGGRLSISTSPQRPELAEDDEEEDETYVDEDHTPEPPTPAPTSKARSQRRRRRSGERSDPIVRRSKGTSFPILTHRLSKVPFLPTIAEEDTHEEADSRVDELHSSANSIDRPTPNAVDILAQICRETITSAIDGLTAQTAGSTSRAEVNRQRSALEAFGQALDRRLFDMSTQTEHRLDLEARLRKAKREKAVLEAQWLDIRRQRDQLALEADGIRKQNWDNERYGKTMWRASELAQKTASTLERQKEMPAGGVSHDASVGVEYMLRYVANRVSSRSTSGGILDQVKRFNAQLEQVASTLERSMG